MFFIDKNKNVSIEMIDKYIELFKAGELMRLQKNKRYYDCKNDTIMNRSFADITKPNNKVAHPWANYISTLISGYFMGKPVSYGTQQEELQNIITSYNSKEIAHNQAVEKDCSIYGVGAELLFLNVQKQVQYEKLDPCTIIPIYSSDITKELLYCIRFWDVFDILTNEVSTHIELYSKYDITYFVKNEKGTTKTGQEQHYFEEVPVNIYYNNPDASGDAEKVLRLVDEYDMLMSDSSNFRAELNDSYLVFKNCNLENEDIVAMKQNRVFSIEDTEQGMQSSIQWLNKDSNDTESENYKTRLADDIKRFSFVADIEAAKSHTSATSAKIGLMGIEQICADKETCFRSALIRRLRMICNIFKLTGLEVSVDDVQIIFTRNVPVDMSVIADTIVKLAPFVPIKLLMAQIPFVSDVEQAYKMKQEENSMNSYEEDIFAGGEVDEQQQ